MVDETNEGSGCHSWPSGHNNCNTDRHNSTSHGANVELLRLLFLHVRLSVSPSSFAPAYLGSAPLYTGNSNRLSNQIQPIYKSPLHRHPAHLITPQPYLHPSAVPSALSHSAPSVLSLQRICSLSRSKTVIFDPKFGKYISCSTSIVVRVPDRWRGCGRIVREKVVPDIKTRA